MGLTVTEDTPADMLAGNMELLVQLPPRTDDEADNDCDSDEGNEDNNRHKLYHRSHHRHHNHNNHHYGNNNGHHPRLRNVNGNARKVIVARSTPMMDLLVQVATSQKLSASSYTLEAIGEHGLVLTHHPNTPIGALDALQVKLLPKQGTFAPMKTRHANQPFEPTFRLQVHLPRNQLYVSRVSARMNLGKILDEVCREKNLDRNNYELRHPANIEETLDPTLSLQDYHLQEVTLCPKRRQLGSSLSSQDIMALQRQEERRRQEAKQSVFGFAFKKSKESSLSTDSLGERSVSPARSDGTGRSASPQAPTAPTRPQRKRRPAPKPPTARVEPETTTTTTTITTTITTTEREINTNRESERTNVISHSRNSSDSSGYHEASVLSDNLDSNIRVPETLPRRSRLQLPSTDSPGRTLAETSEASKSLGNLAVVSNSRSATIARGTSNTSLVSAGLRKKKAAPAPPPPRPLSSAISTQALERIIDSEESLPSGAEASLTRKKTVTEEVEAKVETRSVERRKNETGNDREEGEKIAVSREVVVVVPIPEASESLEKLTSTPNVEPARERKRAVAPVPRPRNAVATYVPSNEQFLEPATTHLHLHQHEPSTSPMPAPLPRDFSRSLNNLEKLIIDGARVSEKCEKKVDFTPPRRPLRLKKNRNVNDVDIGDKKSENDRSCTDNIRSDCDKRIAEELSRRQIITESTESVGNIYYEKEKGDSNVDEVTERERKKILAPEPEEFLTNKVVEGVEKVVVKIEEITRAFRDEEISKEVEDSDVSLPERYNSNDGDKRESERIKPEENNFSEVEKRPDKAEDRKTVLHNLSPKTNFETKVVADALNVPLIEGRRSCAVISTIPKCDNFLKNQNDDEAEEISLGNNESPEYKLSVKVDNSGLRSSFGAGKSILDIDYRRNEDYTGASATSLPLNVTESAEDELEFSSFEMFETPETRRKWTKVLRSNSELNNFEINAFSEGGSRYLTSRSEDFTHALNPNLADINLQDKDKERYYSLKDIKAPKKRLLNILSPVNSATQLPAFLTSHITWERNNKENLPEVEVGAGDVENSTLREPGSNDSALSASTVSVSSAAASEPTSDLLKKVSDTLSGSLRSPTVANGISFPASNDQRSGSESSSLCVDLQTLSSPGKDRECKLEVVNGEAETAISEVIENLPDGEITSEFIDENKDRLASPPDWEYQLPEPPTAFRDTEEIFAEKKTDKKSTVIVEAKEAKSQLPEIISAPPALALKITPEAHDEGIRNASEPMKEEILVDRTRRVVKKEEEELPSDLGRVPWSGIKSAGDTGSRKASYASSTPSIAPVDNPLSNFVITTYTKPKNVDIFGEIERSQVEPRSGGSSRKNSPAFNAFNIAQAAVTDKVSRKNSTEIFKESQPAVQEEKISALAADVHKNAWPSNFTTTKNENEIVENVAVSRSNMKISIATKPRPRAETISGGTLQRQKLTVDLKTEEKKTVEEPPTIDQETDSINNQKFSQWRDNILKKQKTQTAEKQLQSLQVLRSILPESEDSQKHLDTPNTNDNIVDSGTSVETRVEAVVPSVDVPVPVPVPEATNEPRERVKRYTYAGPPAIDLGSWSDRSRSRVQIKSDTDYKVKNSQEPEAKIKEAVNAFSNKTAIANATLIVKPETISTENRELRNKESNEPTKTFIARTTVTGFKKKERPASIAVVEYSSATLPIANRGIKEKEETMRAKEEEIDTRPINFKELKEAFGKEHKINSSTTSASQQFVSKYGSLARRSETFAGKFAVRRDSNASSNGDSDSVTVHQKADNPIEKRNFVLPGNRGVSISVGGFKHQENLRKTNRGTPMPVVKGFKIAAPAPLSEEESQIQQPDKRPPSFRVAIGDISNGNHAPNYVRKNPSIQLKSDPIAKNPVISIPKPPPTMPIITGVTLKTTLNANPRPKSEIVETDPRNQLLESIRGFDGANKLRKVPRRNTNVIEGSGLYARS